MVEFGGDLSKGKLASGSTHLAHGFELKVVVDSDEDQAEDIIAAVAAANTGEI